MTEKTTSRPREERDKVHDLKAERVLRELQEMAKRILRAKGYAVISP